MIPERAKIVSPQRKQWNVRVLILREGDGWAAQCLEIDIAAQGKTVPEARAAFFRAFVGQAVVSMEHGEEPFENIRPAPHWYEDQFENAEPLKSFPIMVPPDTLPEGAPPAWLLNGMMEMRFTEVQH